MKTYKIALLAGDGIGPEVMKQAVKVLKAVEARNPEVAFELNEALFGAVAYFETGKSFPAETIAICDEADAILKGTIGLNHEDSKKIPVDEQPERGALLPLRRRYNTYANFRPVYLPQELAHFSPLKPEVIGEGIDLMIIRELVGGLYFGEKEVGKDDNGKRYVREVLEYDEDQIRDILKVGFETAQRRKKVLHNIHKSNVLKSSVLWNEILEEVAVDYPDVEVKHILVDAAATYLCLNPGQFDVMVMENMFGDILSEEASVIVGSIGLLASASIGDKHAMFEPIHGAYTKAINKGIANPIGAILSAAMLLDYFDLSNEANAIKKAVTKAMELNLTTPDLNKQKPLSTEKIGDFIADYICNPDLTNFNIENIYLGPLSLIAV